ncbi:Zds-C domain-containing protein [Mycena chlorophos]|uniref:Zds-C domain-containing protein n=1 Tax=Mycena chlorophos TaxID=658473 RepID=A0A8H6W7H0_MYCCL|nr:Zds-C domain-containing protein [Mycena chlorophos]
MTDYDIRREVEALRDIRRRSTTPGGLTIDPDLPPNQPGLSPTTTSSPDDPDNIDLTPTSLFWLPANLHPEIAPQEFRAFLKEHARNPQADDGADGLQRAPSLSSGGAGGLGRKKSMLSRQYQPSENDSGDETVVPLQRNRSGIYSSNKNQGPQLTISDLQKLDELAEVAATSDDPARLRNILRRSLSMNVSPLALDDADLGDEADQPIIVAPPGQFLRRTARTRIRKPGLPGDGGGHRFGERRRGPSGRSSTAPGLQRTSSDVSSSDHGDSVESLTSVTPRPGFSDENAQDRPVSLSEEIYESYVRDEDEDLPPTLPPVFITASPPSTITEFADISPIQPVEPEPEPEPLAPVIHQPQPTRHLSPGPSDYQQQPHQGPSRTPSPAEYELSSPTPVPETYSPSASPSNSPPTSSFLTTTPPRKDKDKKGLFSKWGSDKEEKKSSKASKKEARDKERADKEQRDKESGFFGSLFGKKKHDSQPETTGLHGGREAAHALLGQSQRAPRSPGPPSPLIGQPGVVVNNYSRYPIHVERAIYRLSHIKLANPRRPLYEQVLISNLMFWYLGVINKAQTNAQEQQQQQQANGQPAAAANGPTDAERERLERERVEREAAAAAQAEKERQERERMEREQREQQEASRKRDSSPRRGALTKASAGPQQRRAEMPVKGPQYEMQHRVMEKEYAGYNNGNGQRPNVGPGIGAGGQQGYSRQYGPQQEYGYYSPGEAMQQQQRLPPGAMPPVDSASWQPGQPPPSSRSPPPMNAQRRSRSPPPPQHQQQPMPMYNPDGGSGGARLGGRSLSATAAMPSPPPMNGKIRKGHSASVGVPQNARRPQNAAVDQEEDMPLAMYQQRQQRR